MMSGETPPGVHIMEATVDVSCANAPKLTENKAAPSKGRKTNFLLSEFPSTRAETTATTRFGVLSIFVMQLFCLGEKGKSRVESQSGPVATYDI